MYHLISKLAVSALVVIAAVLIGCEGDSGPPGQQGNPGPAGTPGTSEGTVTGTVTNSYAGSGIADLTIATEPAVPGKTIVTDADGVYTVDLPIGIYTLTFAATHFTAQTSSVNLVAGETVAVDIALVPVSGVIISINDSAVTETTAVPGGSFQLSSEVTVMDGSAVTGYAWTQAASVPAVISDADTATPTITLGNGAAYRAELIAHLASDFGSDPTAILDRFMVQPVNPFALEEAGLVSFHVQVTTDSGTYTESVDVHTKLPFAVASTGVRTVPLGLPVLLNGEDQDAYAWTLEGPVDSAAALDDAAIRNPSFTPDVKGKYTLEETHSGVSFDVYGGEWVGIITGQDDVGRPTTSGNCALCHNGVVASSTQFTAWSESGHAEIFTDSLNTSTYYGPGCFPCHTVGYNTGVLNNGLDDQTDYDAFLASGMLNVPGDNWTTMLAAYPESARFANIQCDSCHGPQDSEGGHAGTAGAPRVSLDSGVCAICHGEPLRHGRFQQWQESGHGNFHTAIEEGTISTCAPCHSAQGFVEWSKAPTPFDKDYSVVAPPSADIVQPQTCAACHDPHSLGNASGEPNTATVRLQNRTPELIGGFAAAAVGRGAICMLCHNSRRGPYSTSLYGEDYHNGNVEMEDRTPHAGTQADILMGENAFFVTPGARGSHSLVTDTCANCHMEQTPPPADLSYHLSGTNHTFESSAGICLNCHQTSVLESLQDTVETQLANLETLIEEALKSDIDSIAANTAVTGVLLAYNSDASTYGAMIDDSGDPNRTIASIALQHSYPHGYDVTLVVGTVVVSGHDDMVVWQDAVPEGGNGDGVVDAAEIERGDITSAGIASAQIAGISTNGQDILRAKWNHDLVAFDGSRGIHNPNFVRDALSGAIAGLK